MEPEGPDGLRQLADLHARNHALDIMPSTMAAVQHICGAGLFFLAVDTVLTYGPPAKWLRKKYRQWANPKVKDATLDDTVAHSNTRLVSLLHIAVQIPRALQLLNDPALLASPVYAVTQRSWEVMTFSAGYFVYDLFVHATRFEYWANLAHAIGASSVFAVGVYYGFLHYYGAMFLMWELSTPFVFLRWMLHELGHASSRLYVANGLAMMLVFAGCRNIWGTWMSLDFWRQTGFAMANPIANCVPAQALWVIRTLNLGFNGLNALWLYKMIRGVIKVFGRGKQRKAERAQRAALNGDLSRPVGVPGGAGEGAPTATADLSSGLEKKTIPEAGTPLKRHVE